MAIEVTLLKPVSSDPMPDQYIDIEVALAFKPPGLRVRCVITNSARAVVYNDYAHDRGDNLWQADISATEFPDGYYTVTATGSAEGSDPDEDTATCVIVGEPDEECPDAKAKQP